MAAIYLPVVSSLKTAKSSDSYSKNEDVLNYEEWSNPKQDIQNGLTVVVKGEWVSG